MRIPKLKPKGVVIIGPAPLANVLSGRIATRLNKNFKIGRPVNDNAGSLKVASFIGLFQRLKRRALRIGKHLRLLPNDGNKRLP